MKTVFTICVIIMLCVYIAVEERKIKVTKEEQEDGQWED